ncbi:MAG: hypothetical protein Q8O89_00765 [Nanoarchaeota archaeon]|nr:hypothetical protein [Nanoarchaeota archaeon]
MESILFRKAESKEEIKAAQQIRYAAYRERDYIEENSAKTRALIYDSLATTTIYIALKNISVDKQKSEIIGTASTFKDCSAGLPLEELLKNEVSLLRSDGRKLMEGGALAVLPEFRGSLKTSLGLIRVVIRQLFEDNLDDLVIAIVPQHVDFYEKKLLFEKASGQKKYSSLNNINAVMMRLDSHSYKERLLNGSDEHKELHQYFFGQ